jgi:jumonji domain-containing protein 2
MVKIFRPTWEEFQDFNSYIRKIEDEGAAEAGICKVIPPEGWVPRKNGYAVEEIEFEAWNPISQIFFRVGLTPFFDQISCNLRPGPVLDHSQ